MEGKHYLFVEMSVWKKALDTRTFSQILYLSQTYHIIMTEVQLEELKSYYFGDEYYLIEDLFDNDNDEDNAKAFDELTKLYPKLANFYYTLHTLITDHIYIILKHDDIHIEQTNDRIFNQTPPFCNISDYIGDVLSWTSILASFKIREGFDLYIYTNTTNFFFHKELHPMLCFEWKSHKKGFLRLFDKLKAPVQYKTGDKPTIKKGINKTSPQYMMQRFTNLLELLDNEFVKNYPEIYEIQIMIQESRTIVERLTFNIPDETLLNMKKKLSHLGSKYKELVDHRKYSRNE